MKVTRKSATVAVQLEFTVDYTETLSQEGQDADGNRGYYERECQVDRVTLETAGIPSEAHGALIALATAQFEREYN